MCYASAEDAQGMKSSYHKIQVGGSLPNFNSLTRCNAYFPISVIFDHPPSCVVYNFSHVCLSVCLPVLCLKYDITFESLDIGSPYLQIRYILRDTGEVRIHDMKVIKVKGAKNVKNSYSRIALTLLVGSSHPY